MKKITKKATKKIVSLLVVAMMLATCMLATVSASAATKAFEIDWTALAYTVYNENGTEIDELTFLDSFEVTKDAKTLGVNRIGSGLQANSYVSTSQFAITADTSYTYEVMAKNNNTAKYSGVPFAIDTEGAVYFIYGSFDNNNDSVTSQSGKSYVISAKGNFDNKYPNSTGNEFDAMYFKKLQLTDGFASFKFEYNGLTVTIYAKDTNGSYVKMGEDVTLPEGSKLVFGVFSRDNEKGGNRTTTVKNAKITGNNDAAVKNMVIESNNGASDLKSEILRIEKEYLEIDYTAATYKAVKTALENAKAAADDSFSTAEEITAAREALTTSVEALVLADPDFTELEAAIEEAEEINKDDYTRISYDMVVDAIEKANMLIDADEVKQSQINAAIETLKGRIDGLIPAGSGASDDENGDENGDENEDGANDGDDENADESTSATQAPIPQAPIPQAPTPNAKKGCKSAVGTTAVALGIVAIFGTAIVVKKKD